MGLPLVLGCGFLAALPCVVLLVLRLYIRGHPVAPIKNRLDGRVIIITGGSSGIGRAAALECARRGAKVILACRDAAKAEAVVLSIRRKTSNEEVHFRQLDLASLVSVREFVGQFTKQFGRVHTIVNNAGNSVSPLKNHSLIYIPNLLPGFRNFISLKKMFQMKTGAASYTARNSFLNTATNTQVTLRD